MSEVSQQSAEMSQESVAAFLQELGRLIGQHVPVPDFGDLIEVDDEANGPGLVRATPDDIEAAVVMGLQRAAIEQEMAAEEARFAKQSEVIAETQTRAENATPPGENVRLLAGDAEMERASVAIAAALAASRTLGDAFGKPREAFQAAADEANAAIEARDKTIDEVNEAAAKILSERLVRLAAVKRELEAQNKTILPESEDIVAKRGSRGAPKNLKDGQESAKLAVQALDDGSATTGGDAFNGLEQSVREALKVLPGLIRNVNQMALDQRKSTRKELVAGVAFGQGKPPPSELEMLPSPQAAQAFQAAVDKHSEEYRKLAALLPETSADAFESALKTVRELRNDADSVFIALRQEISKAKTGRVARMKELRGQKAALPPSTAKNGTQEFTDLAKAEQTAATCLHRVDQLCASGTPSAFQEADDKAVQAIADLGKAITKANQDAKDRQDRLERLKKDLDDYRKGIASSIPATGALPDDGIRTALNTAAGKRYQELLKLLTGIDEAEDQKNAQLVRALIDKTKDVGTEVKRVTAQEWARTGTNVFVTEKMKAVAKTLKDSGVGDAAILEIKALRTLVGQLYTAYDNITKLAPRVTNATTNHPTVLPDQQVILATFAADTAATELNKKDKSGIDQLYQKFSAAVRAVEEQVAEDAYQASPVGLFIASFKANRANNQAQVLTDLDILLTNGTAAVAPGRDAYQCDGEQNQEFSVERELRVGGQGGILIHAHCRNNGSVKNGNGFHIKLSKDRHRGGCGVMLAGASRNTLIASFDSAGNLDEKDRTVGVVWR
jgi:hypothetical protein